MILFNVEFEAKMVHGLFNPFPGPIVSQANHACPRLLGLKAPDLHHRRSRPRLANLLGGFGDKLEERGAGSLCKPAIAGAACGRKLDLEGISYLEGYLPASLFFGDREGGVGRRER